MTTRPILIPTSVSQTAHQIAARSRQSIEIVTATIMAAIAAGTVRAITRQQSGCQWTEFQAVKS